MFYNEPEYNVWNAEREYIKRKQERRYKLMDIFKVIGAGLCFFSALLMVSLFMWVM